MSLSRTVSSDRSMSIDDDIKSKKNDIKDNKRIYQNSNRNRKTSRSRSNSIRDRRIRTRNVSMSSSISSRSNTESYERYKNYKNFKRKYSSTKSSSIFSSRSRSRSRSDSNRYRRVRSNSVRDRRSRSRSIRRYRRSYSRNKSNYRRSFDRKFINRRDTRDIYRDTRDYDHDNFRDSREVRDMRDPLRGRDIRETPRDTRDARDFRDFRDMKDIRDIRRIRDIPKLQENNHKINGRRKDKIDRKYNTPFLLPVQTPSEDDSTQELHVYVWLDSTLRDLVNLIKDISPPTRKQNNTWTFSTPIGNGMEWRARYCELDLKKAKHFSCNRYGHNRSYFLSTLYLTSIKLFQHPLSTDDILFWYNVIKDFKSLDDIPQKVPIKPITRTTNYNISSIKKLLPDIKSKLKLLEESNISIFNGVIDSIVNKEYVIGVIFPIPELSKQSISNEFNNLLSILKYYQLEIDKGKLKIETPKVQSIEKTITLQDLFDQVFNYNINNAINGIINLNDGSGSGNENELDEDIIKLIKINKKKYNKVYKILNNFILNTDNTIDSIIGNHGTSINGVNTFDNPLVTGDGVTDGVGVEESDDPDTVTEELIKIINKNNEIIKEMSNNFKGFPYYTSNKETFINTFNHLFNDANSDQTDINTFTNRRVRLIDDDINTLAHYYKHNSLYHFFTSFKVFRYGVMSTDSITLEEEEYIIDKSIDLNKICNERLNSLLRQTEHLQDNELMKVLCTCFEQESKSSSDLSSLIRICTINPQNTGEILYKSNRLYQITGIYTGKYIDVIYKYGKIIPKSSLKFYTNHNHEIILKGSEKMDVNIEMIERIFNKNYNQSENVELIMDNLKYIDEKLKRLIKENENMHKAIYMYINSSERDLNSKNYLEELVNLETLNIIIETLMQTKLKLINQVYNYYNSQVNFIENIIPKKYFQTFKEIFYHKYEQF
ncbi:uncharacterized protein TA18375 [Theileria annulata]|uniref:Uncharacterized protein n=1 Tax=Theileria annulata TaxID=5874 RepID=Q4UAX8_THEAN|nr:uncharacterized protein TA18375 [Theileria annulata]CAI76023.1 hypothetical protein TA18375 [Theileria annulata]|eukprot:XP_955499.1 hypothetical protein TA18375 [Theileria annulata]